MNDTVSSLYSRINDVLGLPQEYKKINFRPIKLVDYRIYESIYVTLGIPKNYVPDARILRMSYLKYILYVVQASIDPEGRDIQERIISILKHSCKTQEVEILWFLPPDRQDLDGLTLKIMIDGVEFNEVEFENIREIILEQNDIGVDYIEQYHPELEAKLSIFRKDQDNINFEDEIFVFLALMKKTFEEVENISVFQFKRLLEKLMLLQDFEMYKPLEASGQIKLQNGAKIQHFLTHSGKKNRYDSILVDKSSYIDNSDIFKVAQTN